MALLVHLAILTLFANSVCSSSFVEVSGRLFTHGAESVRLRPAQGAVDTTPAWTFSQSGMCLNDMVSQEVGDLMKLACHLNKCFTVSFMVRVEKKMASGVLLSVRSGQDVVFDVVFKRNVQIRLRHSVYGRLTWDRFYYEFTIGQWYDVAFVFCPHSGFVTLYVDCNRIYKKFVNFSAGCTGSDWRVCIGKLANGEIDQLGFVGSVQNLRLYLGNVVDALCSLQLTKSSHERLLEQTVVNLKSKLAECRKHYCVVNGIVYANGSAVPPTSRCTQQCHCQNGKVECTEEACPHVQCLPLDQFPANFTAGKCCPTCPPPKRRPVPAVGRPRYCVMGGKKYQEGATMYKKTDLLRCHPCKCKNRMAVCQSKCRPPLCPPERRYRWPGTCCVQCLDHDVCSDGDHCGAGDCVNLPNRRVQCMCHPGATWNKRTRRCDPGSTQPPTTFPPLPVELFSLLG